MILVSLICYRNDVSTCRPGTVPYFFLDVPYGLLSFLSRSRIRRESLKYGLKYCVGHVDGYFVGWQNREIHMISPEECAMLYVRIPDL